MIHAKDFKWTGSDSLYIDEPKVIELNQMTVGLFGGCSKAGQTKNEDGCIVWSDDDWEFVMLLDAHKTAESTELTVKQFESKKLEIKQLLNQPLTPSYFKKLESFILSVFQEEAFLTSCRNVSGETACLIAVRKGQYIWWFSIGDCVLYLFHPELAALGQYELNQRQYFEWVGEVNTFELAVPCYSSGTRELRKGWNHLFMTTDGLLECPDGPFSDSKNLSHAVLHSSNKEDYEAILKTIQEKNVKDSTVFVSWKRKMTHEACMPSDMV